MCKQLYTVIGIIYMEHTYILRRYKLYIIYFCVTLYKINRFSLKMQQILNIKSINLFYSHIIISIKVFYTKTKVEH